MCLKYAVRVLFSLATTLVETVGNLDVVNTLVAEGGLQKRVLLPMLVVDTVDCIEPIMPAKRRAVPTGTSHTQTKNNRRPKSSGQTAVVEEKVLVNSARMHAFMINDIALVCSSGPRKSCN